MTKVYSLEEETQVLDEKVRIKVKETKSVTSEKFVSVEDLKRRHEQVLEEIERQKEEADLIVDQITEINDDEGIEITVKDIPAKLIK